MASTPNGRRSLPTATGHGSRRPLKPIARHVECVVLPWAASSVWESAWFAISCWLRSEPPTTQTNRGLRSRPCAAIGSVLVHSPGRSRPEQGIVGPANGEAARLATVSWRGAAARPASCCHSNRADVFRRRVVAPFVQPYCSNHRSVRSAPSVRREQAPVLPHRSFRTWATISTSRTEGGQIPLALLRDLTRSGGMALPWARPNIEQILARSKRPVGAGTAVSVEGLREAVQAQVPTDAVLQRAAERSGYRS
jgi:hypothetical protein